MLMIMIVMLQSQKKSFNDVFPYIIMNQVHYFKPYTKIVEQIYILYTRKNIYFIENTTSILIKYILFRKKEFTSF